MKSFTSLLLLLPFLLSINADDSFWIVRHGHIQATRLDPIVSPGGVSGHTHAIIGSSSFEPTYTYENNLKGKCTTANVDVDKSSYWVPQLYRKQADGTLIVAPLRYANTYYQMRRTGQEEVAEFPPGFRMLSGDQSRISYDPSDPAQDAIRYACLGVSGPETHEFPKQKCPLGLRAQVTFAHCWDGVNNWLEGNAHVAFGEGNFDGGEKCPSSHPKRIMSIFYEFVFEDNYDYVPGARVWATGDDLGYSLHGDFTNGWPEGLFSDIFSYGDQCKVDFSLEDCPALAPHLVNPSDCKFENLIVNEDIGETTGLTKLPGNNPLWGSSGPKKPDPNYVEKAEFIPVGGGATVQPSGVPQYARVEAGDIHIGTVKNDQPPYTGPKLIPGSGATHYAGGSGAQVTSASVASPTGLVGNDTASGDSSGGAAGNDTASADLSADAADSTTASVASQASASSSLGGQVLIAIASSSTAAASQTGSPVCNGK